MVASLIPAAGIASIAVEAQEDSGRQVIELWNSDEDGKTSFMSLLQQTVDNTVTPPKPRNTPLQKNTTYKLMEDIDMGGVELTGEITAVKEKYTEETTDENGEPVTVEKERVVGYTGTGYINFADGVIFDGQGHSITGFKLTGGLRSALFNAQTGNTAASVTVKNVSFGTQDSPIKFEHGGGAYNQLVGFAIIRATDSKTTLNIEGVTAYVDGNCKGENWQEHGAFVGRNWGSINFKDCVANGTLKGHGFIGAFVGATRKDKAQVNNKITFTNCENRMNISADGGGYYGGFIGRINDTANVEIIDSANYGDINAERAVGGFVGDMSGGGRLTVIGSQNRGNITGKKSTGGIIGHAAKGSVDVRSFTNYGSVKATSEGGDAGGIIGLVGSEITGKQTIDGKEVTVVTDATAADVTVNGFVNYASVMSEKRMAGGAVGKVIATSGQITVNNIVNGANIGTAGKTSAASAAIGNSECNAALTNERLSISVNRLVNLGNLYAIWNTGAAIGFGGSATLTVTNCISTGTMNLSNNNSKGDVFAKYVSENTETEKRPIASVTASGNIYLKDSHLNSLAAEKKTVADIFALLLNSENGYTSSYYSFGLNAAKNGIVILIPPSVKGCQIKDSGNGMLSIRFIGAIHSTAYKEVGFKIQLDGGETQSISGNKVISEIRGTNADGKLERVSAESMLEQNLYALAYGGVAATGSHTLYVIPFSVGADDTVYEGLGYTVTVTDGVLVDAVRDTIVVPDAPEGGETPPEGGDTPPEGGDTPPEGGETPPEGGDTPTEPPELDIPVVEDTEGSGFGTVIPGIPF